MPVCKVCSDTFPNRIRVDGVTRVIASRRACLTCVPFKSGTRIESVQRPNYTHCIVCEKPNNSNRRRRCGSCNTKVRRYLHKAAAIKLLGGVCIDCGWTGPQAGFSFHHEHSKEFGIGNVANKSWAVIKKELRKCVLLCVRCHSLHHSDRENPRLLDEIERIMGSRQIK